MRLLVLTIAFASTFAACDMAQQPVTIHDSASPPERLSAWAVVFADGKQFELNEGVVPYGLNTPLFSDYALKLRTVWMPEGTGAQYNYDREFDFPIGTIISKTFHYEKADSSRTDSMAVVQFDRESVLDDKGRLSLDDHVLIETRLLIRYEQGWKALPYVWNSAQDEAYLEVAGELRNIKLVTPEASQDIAYVIPDANQCAGCHTPDYSAKEIRLLGPKAWQLNRPYAWWGDTNSQLEHWSSNRMLTGYTGTAPPGVRWSDPGVASLEQRARAYLDANCAHCHNSDGAADTSALHLNRDAPMDRFYGVCKSPVAVGRGSGDRPYDIYPGHPDRSILLYRMQHSDPAIAMPELGRSAIHAEAVALIHDWIAGMNGEC